ncbi:MAG: hypothetical protein IH955_08890, partial [Chloroflexi bacterium]|nr:hypothetical protein [Chloroflexota bacterium]
SESTSNAPTSGVGPVPSGYEGSAYPVPDGSGGAHVNEVAEPTMFMLANSWYLGVNIPGKPRVFTPYAGGMGTYRKKCNEVADDDYEGFILDYGNRERTKLAT